MDYEVPAFDRWETAQPYEDWARVRSDEPVLALASSGFDSRPNVLVTRFADVEQVLRDHHSFSASINAEVIGRFMGDLILGMDGEEHRAYRALVAHAFRRSALERWRDELIGPVVEQVLDRIAPAGRADLVETVTARYPVQVICGIVGVPLDDHEQFHRWAELVNTGPLHPTEGMAASRAMREYLEPLVAARREAPTGDLLSELVHAEVDGERLSDERLYGFLRLLLPAGAETTFRVMGNALAALLTHPGLLERVRADRALLGPVIEETLRWESSVTMVSRIATTETVIGGCPVAAGSSITVLTGAANHDPERWDAPEVWDPDRTPRPHLAFGTGEHQCLGMHLARMELEIGLGRVLDRLPNLRLDPDATAPVIAGYAFRGPDALHAVWDPV
jgi:cytochrome P450